MAGSLPRATVRQVATSGRGAVHGRSLPESAVSHRARMSATECDASAEEAPAERLDVEIVRAVMDRLHVPVKVFAIRADASRSQVSEALAGTAGRHLAFGWLLAQGAEFMGELQAEIDRRLGLTPRSKRAAKAELIAELVRTVFETGERVAERAS